ncbi:hypothetical protein C7534_1383 [Pseudomonas sp. OV226]|nr:hypothetical protein C7534_1383 [Pseudomonas sp. OV226]
MAFGFYAGLISSLGYIMEKLSGAAAVVEPFVWACTAAFFTLIFSLGALGCGYTQQLKQDEIDRLCKVKADLEGQVLRRRISSKGRKST